MSALPATFLLPPLTRDKQPSTTPRKRTALRAMPCPAPAKLQPTPTKAQALMSAPGKAAPAATPAFIPGVSPALDMDFTTIYRTYRRRVYSQCFCMLHNQDDAEDATQEVFLQVYRKVHTFRGDSSFSTWLHRLTTNCVLMEIRRKRHRCLEATPREASPEGGADKAGWDGTLDSFQAPSVPIFERITLGAAQSQLPIGYQRIFELHDVEGRTHEEIASLLGIQVGTSKSQLHKARLRMRGLL